MSGSSSPKPERLVLRPGRIHALGLTYRDHAAETGESLDDDARPMVFQRDPASLNVTDHVRVPSEIVILQCLERLEPGLGVALKHHFPEVPPLLDYEVELGLVLQSDVTVRDLDDHRRPPPAAAFLANDVTVRTVQILGEGAVDRMAFWTASKSFPTTLLTGEVMVPLDADAVHHPLALTVNGAVRQRSDTGQLRWNLRALLRFAAEAAGGLSRGDVVLTGTPGGIALAVPRWQRWLADRLLSRFGRLGAAVRRARRPGSRFLRHGDVLQMEGGALGCRTVRIEASR